MILRKPFSIGHFNEFTQMLTYIIWTSLQPTCLQGISVAIEFCFTLAV